jgi:phage gp16-like protein
MTETRTLTRQQLAVIHIALQQLRFDDATYRDMLARVAGVSSARELNRAGFMAVMDHLTRCGFRSDWTKRTFGNRHGRATPAQVELIRALWREWSGADEEAALNKWLARFYHCDALRFLTPPTAGKAIEGLKAMVARKRKAA